MQTRAESSMFNTRWSLTMWIYPCRIDESLVNCSEIRVIIYSTSNMCRNCLFLTSCIWSGRTKPLVLLVAMFCKSEQVRASDQGWGSSEEYLDLGILGFILEIQVTDLSLRLSKNYLKWWFRFARHLRLTKDRFWSDINSQTPRRRMFLFWGVWRFLQLTA